MKGNGTTNAILLGVWATFALDVFSTLNSSPQTTELFAGDREDTLMHWVLIGDATALAGGVAGAAFSRNVWPLVAAGGVCLMMHFLYRHAVARGTGEQPPSSSIPQSGWDGS
jgi:hypothetical protein